MSAMTTVETSGQGHILVVDDNPLNRMVLTRALETQGYTVATAGDGRQALESLRATGTPPFDVVLLDILMPELDGYETLARIKRDEALRHIPVIVISAVDELESVIRCIEMGATDYLPKPFNAALLRARVSASLASKRLHDLEQAHLRAIQAERERADRLLLNILPAPIAERLKREQRTIAEHFADVSVLFADLVGFTPYAARCAPAEVVDVLNAVFSAFDRLTEEHGLEKIKTIGDSYMAVSGLPIPRPGHAEAAAEMALGMQTELKRLNADLPEPLSLRIGIHSGPVVAGVIGAKKFAYDLWGDTVNTASRMESHGVVDRIQVSAATYERLRGAYDFREQGTIRVKGKGEMRTYLLVERREPGPVPLAGAGRGAG